MNLEPIGSNMTQVRTENYSILFSYKTPVACVDLREHVAYKTDKKWSVTTSRHINKWLAGNDAATRPQSFFDALV